ncbi:acyltransferase PGAP2-like isoform X2 [Tachypleus tridentatus]|uniref:acyltransferase PGAP2-like isoform X2 n=1 Tax=Tachypleus tridentatus TaxID=6853 RepID=UPI003FD25A2B
MTSIKIAFRRFAIVTVSLPLYSFMFCVIWSLLYDFKSSTATHCHVRNYLPSISAAIGGFTPQLYIWRVGIGLHAAPRFVVIFMYFTFYRECLLKRKLWQRLGILTCCLHAVENVSLIGLTYISSSDNYPAHEKLFITFMLSSSSYMLLSCILPRLAFVRKLSDLERRSLKTKSFLITINVSALLGACYFFMRHNWYCETGMYTLFALCEYIAVLTNMGFHMTACWDFANYQLRIYSNRIDISKTLDFDELYFSLFGHAVSSFHLREYNREDWPITSYNSAATGI